MKASRPLAASPDADERLRLRLRIEGVVQGVGFRPHVYRLARSLDLAGFVLNDARGVLVEVEGAPAAIRRFADGIAAEAPPTAAVERVRSRAVTATGAREFRIRESGRPGSAATLVPPDTATCPDCLGELFDSADRRYRHPFINCTACGPRFTIVRGVPYDRARTAMAGFEMCARCRAEYEDPGDRRFHAQPNSCHDCGPRLRLVRSDGGEAAHGAARDTVPGAAGDAVAAASRAIAAGAIVAVKGIGGYHLACPADDPRAVARLRARKRRPARPFAVMVADVGGAKELAHVRPEEERLLSGRDRPIVLLRRREGADIAEPVAPGHRDVGIMLAYSPVHHLLLADTGRPLVMTSGNVSGEPIAHRDDEALEGLAGIADLFLVHDRPIELRADDSVVRVVDVAGARRPMVLRRSRGMVPVPEPLPPGAIESVTACGAHLKNTYAVAHAGRAWIGPHVGDLDGWEARRSYRDGLARFEEMFGRPPAVIAHDLHPDYASTRYAVERGERVDPGEREHGAGRAGRGERGTRTHAVQHHHAHLAACLAEHGEEGPALGAIFDGTGLGTDGTVWGGELLLGDLSGFERVGHLRPVRMPGGEAAVREPWRMALAWLAAAAGSDEAPRIADAHGPDEPPPPLPAALESAVDEPRWKAVASVLRSGAHAPVTTSVGRLFDAVSALCGICARVEYEGQAAIELEAAARGVDGGDPYRMPLARSDEGRTVIDAAPTIRGVARDVANGVPVALVAARFHEALAQATAGACAREAARGGVEIVVLSGGVFQNPTLLERTAELVAERGLRLLVPGRVPPNDGGIAYGQAAVAASLRGV